MLVVPLPPRTRIVVVARRIDATGTADGTGAARRRQTVKGYETTEKFYIVMEPVVGGDLFELVKKAAYGNPLSWMNEALCCKIFRQARSSSSRVFNRCVSGAVVLLSRALSLSFSCCVAPAPRVAR